MKRRMKVGKEFDVENVVVSEVDTHTRRTLTLVLLAVGALFLFGSAAKGILDKDFETLNAVWNVEGPVVGLMAGFFYKAQS
jgi:predicted MFS family arabinose efflux permease